MYQIKLTNYFDVLKDGDVFSVNNQCIEFGDVYIKEFDKESVLKMLKATGYLKKHVRINMLNFEEYENGYEIFQKNNNCPLFLVESIREVE